jgi:hypothetical protein
MREHDGRKPVYYKRRDRWMPLPAEFRERAGKATKL